MPTPPPVAAGATEIPFTLTAHNNIVFRARVNDADPVELMLHSAASDVTLTEESARRTPSVRFADAVRVKSWGGEARSRSSKGNCVQIGGLRRTDIEIRENQLSGHGTDGKVGLDFFKGHVVEIDFDRTCVVLHDRLPPHAETYHRVAMEDRNGDLLVAGSLLLDGQSYDGRFLIHTGYSGGILLDDAFAASAGVADKIKVTDESSLKDSFGRTIGVRKGVLPAFALGATRVKDVPVGFFAGAVGGQKMSVLGCEVLKRFRLVFDRTNSALYLGDRRA